MNRNRVKYECDIYKQKKKKKRRRRRYVVRTLIIQLCLPDTDKNVSKAENPYAHKHCKPLSRINSNNINAIRLHRIVRPASSTLLPATSHGIVWVII